MAGIASEWRDFDAFFFLLFFVFSAASITRVTMKDIASIFLIITTIVISINVY